MPCSVQLFFVYYFSILSLLFNSSRQVWKKLQLNFFSVVNNILFNSLIKKLLQTTKVANFF